MNDVVWTSAENADGLTHAGARQVREPTRSDFDDASEIVARYLRPSPVIESPGLGPRVYLKLETLQPTGSFKVRGALAAVAKISASEPSSRIIAASAGNHGLGVAFASTLLGVDTTIVVPNNASAAKRSALEDFDVQLLAHGSTYDEAEAYAIELATEGRHFVSPYNDPDVIAGQGSITAEILEQVPSVGSIVVPVGGGGLIAGVALGKALVAPGSHIGVFGVEASASRALSSCVAAGHTVTIDVAPTLADGLAGNVEPGSVTVPIAAAHAAGIVGVSESSIRDAVAYLFASHGLVAEPSGAVGVAALMCGALDPGAGSEITSADTVLVISGRNVARPLLSDLLNDAMIP